MQRVEVAEAHAEHREVSANRAVQDGHEEERKAQRAATTGAQHPEEVGERRKVGVEWRPRDEDGPLAPHDCDRGDEAHERRDAVPTAGIELCALGACARSRVRLSRRSTAAVCPQSASALPSPQPLRSARCPDAQTARTSLVLSLIHI